MSLCFQLVPNHYRNNNAKFEIVGTILITDGPNLNVEKLGLRKKRKLFFKSVLKFNQKNKSGLSERLTYVILRKKLYITEGLSYDKSSIGKTNLAILLMK